jgi:hypothetical protein
MSTKTTIAALAALATIIAGPALAGSKVTKSMDAYASSVDVGARAAGNGFEGWPTDYLVNRFGDHQAQGSF